MNVESGPENHFATPLRMALERKKKKAAKKLQELQALEKAPQRHRLWHSLWMPLAFERACKVPGGNHSEVPVEAKEFRLRKKPLR